MFHEGHGCLTRAAAAVPGAVMPCGQAGQPGKERRWIGGAIAVVVGGGAPNKVPVRTKPVATAKKKVVAKKQPAKKKK